MDSWFIVLIGIFYSLLGLALGSFSNVLIYRLGNNLSLNFEKRSICPNCNAHIKWYDNIPIISYIILRGKCRSCHEHISIQYPLVELTGLIIFLGCFFMNFTYMDFTWSFNYKSIIYAFIILILFNMSIIDIKIYEIPYTLSIPFMILCVSIYITDCILKNDYLLDNIIGFISPLVLLGLIYLIGRLFFKKEVIGLGDVILFSFIGLMLNYKHILLILLLSTFICAVIELTRKIITKKDFIIPFVPYIALSCVISMFLGDLIINSYLTLIGVI